MANMICEISPLVEGKTGFNINQIPYVKAWIESLFDAAGKDVPDFEYTPQSITHFHNLAVRSQANTEAALIVANDLHQKAAEYSSQGHPPCSLDIFCSYFYGCSCFCTSILIKQPASTVTNAAARIREVLENVGLARDTLPPNVVSASQVVAKVANLLDVRDTELSRWVAISS